MRMEKGFLHWKSDLITEFDPFETGLDRFVKMGKPDFIKPRWTACNGVQKRLVSLEITAIMRPPMAVHRLCRATMSLGRSLRGMGVSRW